MNTIPSNTAAQAPAASVCLESFAQLKRRGITYSRVHLGRLIAAGTFPKPVKPAGGHIFFLSSELDQWTADLVAKRDGGAA